MAIPEISPGAGFYAKKVGPGFIPKYGQEESQEVDFGHVPLFTIFKDPRVGIDVTTIDMSKKIDHSVYDQVVEAAKIMQTEYDLPFEVGDFIFYPTSKKIYEVEKIFDNRERMALRNDTPYLLVCRHGKEYESLNGYSVLHLGYLIQAHRPYNPDYSTDIEVNEINEEFVNRILEEITKDDPKKQE
jgi:hypothetical protein